ncbi:MAG: calcium/sodium antiporter, partial [Lentisphaerae bacterium]|nr:calcium/sodium antiporter [Lentisphaerota bacterium]
MIESILIIIGLVLLYYGAEWLVGGGASLAVKAGVTPLVVGLTVVAFGTSCPELVVSVDATLSHHGEISIGNIVGSNIFNIAFILGLSAMIRPLKVQMQLIRFDTPIMIAASVLFVIFFLDKTISRMEAMILFVGILAYTVTVVRMARKEVKKNRDDGIAGNVHAEYCLEVCVFFIIAGLTALVVGARIFVEGSVMIAQNLKISEAVIGLTIVAAGTSLPELATSVVAAAKKQSDISIGNIVGSNIFNILCIIGIAGIISPIYAPGISSVDLGMMLVTAILLFPLMRTGFVITRIEGFALVSIYLGYLW